MRKNEEYIKTLEEFRSLLLDYIDSSGVEKRSQINRKIEKARKIVFNTGCGKFITVSPPPAVGGMIMQNIDPFTCIFDPPYGVNVISIIIDCIDSSIGILDDDIDFNFEKPKETLLNPDSAKSSNKIFLIHGHDNHLKEEVARFLEKINLAPIILHEQSNQGMTIIEKFEHNSDVDFAIALMTPDDLGNTKEEIEIPKKRARQNVIFELGYFIGKIGRKHVIALMKDNLEKPSDYDGVIYIGYDNYGAWKMLIAKELKEAGNIDMNKVIQ